MFKNYKKEHIIKKLRLKAITSAKKLSSRINISKQRGIAY